MSSEPERSLRRGWTTGACATAATRAAYTALLGDGFPDPVTITLPGGQRPAFALAREALADESATAGIVKGIDCNCVSANLTRDIMLHPSVAFSWVPYVP